MQRRYLMILAAVAAASATTGVHAQVVDLSDAINKAGRQRMLSQRLAKFYMAAMLLVDASVASAEITKSRTEFLNAMDLLRNALQVTERIRAELQLADGQWFFFDQALKNMQAPGANPKGLSDVFVTSENLLSVMDRVTGMYAAITT